MYKVSIVDDESAACDAIEKQLLEYGSEHDVEFSAERYLGAEAYMADLGLEGFAQGAEAAQAEYIPPFDLTGV